MSNRVEEGVWILWRVIKLLILFLGSNKKQSTGDTNRSNNESVNWTVLMKK